MSSKRAVLLIIALFPGLLMIAFAFAQSEKGGGFTATAPISSDWYQKSYALVVGINSYSHGWARLSAGVSDAKKVAEALRARGYIVDELYDAQATSSAILTALRRNALKTSSGDAFMFYYSGHGYTKISEWDKTQAGFLVPVDAKSGDITNYLPMSQLRDEILANCKAKHVLFVIDSCFSGTLLTRADVQDGVVADYLSKRGIYGITAGMQDQPAVDGLFTAVFVDGLTGNADFNNDGYVSFKELGLYAEQNVKARNHFQTPDYGVMYGAGQFVFAKASVAPPPSAATPPPAQVAQGGGLRSESLAYTPLKMVKIPAGKFMMGSPANEKARDEDEGPQHQVTFSRPFMMSATEISQALWRAIMGSNPSHFSGCGEDCPVENVSWYDVITFCNYLSDKEKLTHCYQGVGENITWDRKCTGYRLPTEAEWEYAARAGTSSALASGDTKEKLCSRKDTNMDLMGWYCGNAETSTHPVGRKQPNAWGLYDMHGNVWEWVWDWGGPYGSRNETDPIGPDAGTNRQNRGGAWSSVAGFCRSANRDGSEPGYKYANLGFRVIKSQP